MNRSRTARRGLRGRCHSVDDGGWQTIAVREGAGEHCSPWTGGTACPTCCPRVFIALGGPPGPWEPLLKNMGLASIARRGWRERRRERLPHYTEQDTGESKAIVAVYDRI